MTLRHISILLYVLRGRSGRREAISALQGEAEVDRAGARPSALFKGRPNDDTTAHIHFALCVLKLDRAARDHIKQIRYVP